MRAVGVRRGDMRASVCHGSVSGGAESYLNRHTAHTRGRGGIHTSQHVDAHLSDPEVTLDVWHPIIGTRRE